jgi:hypothetical protein
MRLLAALALLILTVHATAGAEGLPQRGDFAESRGPIQLPVTLNVGDWFEILPAGEAPVPRREHCAVYDAANDRMFVYGGASSQGKLGDTWVLDLSGTPRWTRLDLPVAPGARCAAAAVHDPVRNRMIVFGGDDGSVYRNDVWALELGEDPSWASLNPSGTPPSPRTHSTAIYDATNDRVILFGGYPGLGDVWGLSLSLVPPVWRLIYAPLTCSPTLVQMQ